MQKFENVDAYIASFQPQVQAKLAELRAIVKRVAPEAEEILSYGMPAYRMHKILVYFGGHTRHVGLYPMAAGIEAFKHELGPYVWSKGTVQFPIDAPLPVELIERIVRFRVSADLGRSPSKVKRKG